MMEPDEQNNANPYLADFYADKTRWSFTMQVHLLGARYQMQLAAQWHAMAGLGHSVLDRSYYGDVCFARMMNRTGEITDREFNTYRTLYKAMTASVLLPSVCIRLRVDPQVAAERIRRRAEAREGRKFESVIDLTYLQNLDEEIEQTVGVLRSQGVHIYDVPWNTDRQAPEERLEFVGQIAGSIQQRVPQDLFVQHHRRVVI
jgi:deoxyadenosine/deoxycytidine kinase